MHFYSVSRQKVQLDLVPTKVSVHERVPTVHSALAIAGSLVSAAAQAWFGIGLITAVPTDTRKVRRLQSSPPAVFRERNTGLVRMVYREAVIRFRKGISEQRIDQILRRHGYKLRHQNRFVREQFVVFQPSKSGAAVLEAANDCAEMEEVVFATPNFVSQYGRTQAPPINNEQWHLQNTGRYAGQKNGEDVGASEAWEVTPGSGKITVAVLDDGVDIDHPNLAPNIRRNPDPNEPKDLFGCDYYIPDDKADHFNPRPKIFNYPYDQMRGNDIHGTACAGVIAAAGIDGGAIGVAPNCKLLPVKIFHADKLAADERIADAIRYASLHADVLSCSWFGGYSTDVEMALLDSRALGRNGKGSVLVFASGNDHGGPVRFPARHEEVLAVGASTDKATFAPYSNQGSEQCVVAPSSGGVRKIFTTDLSLLNRGFNPGDKDKGGADGLHTNSFGGTSASAPQVAGVAALMLSVRPEMDRVEVRDIIRSTAEKIGTGYDANGHSNKFGFGRVNAAAAVSKAASGST
jgi:subtilisin family serine protease